VKRLRGPLVYRCRWKSGSSYLGTADSISQSRPVINTRRFIMFFVITNIYTKKIKGPSLMELFTGTGKLKTFFSTTRNFRYVHDGWHGTHWYDFKFTAAVNNIDAPTLTSVWQDLEYRIDECHVTRGAPLKIFSCKKTLWVFLWL
jgi:hypothetical protein